MQKVYREIGARIRTTRLSLKLTQAQVAEKAGIDASFYGQLERGTNTPSLRTLFAVAAVLHVEPSELLPRTKSRSGKGSLTAETLDSMISSLKPARRRFLLGVVRDISDELDR